VTPRRSCFRNVGRRDRALRTRAEIARVYLSAFSLAASRQVTQEVSVKHLPEPLLLLGIVILFLVIILLNVGFTAPVQ
jgi:hypothetical protein